MTGRPASPGPTAAPRGRLYLACLLLGFRCLVFPVLSLLAFLLFLVLFPFSFLGRQGTVDRRCHQRPGENLGDSKAASSERGLSRGWLGSFWKGAQAVLAREHGELEGRALGGNVSTTENSTFSSTMVTVVPASRKALRGTRSLSVCCIS